MKAAISGQSGFFGSHFTTALSALGYQVLRVPQVLLYSPEALRTFFEKEKPELIFHAAAYGNMSSQKDEDTIVLSNILGTYNMLQASKGIDYKAFVHFGSSSEYGKKEVPMSEHDILQPETIYGASKTAATQLALYFRKQYEKPIVVIRPFSVYGPQEADFRFIPTVIRSMIKKEVFPLEEKAVHDWIYIDDFISGVLLAVNNIHKTQGLVNIGTGRMHTNKEVCEMLKKISGIQYLSTPRTNLRPTDSPVWMSDNARIGQLGFFPKTMLYQGLEKTWQYYKEKYA